MLNLLIVGAGASRAEALASGVAENQLPPP
jgi:hypothetical protein